MSDSVMIPKNSEETEPCSISDFAKAMNCSDVLLNRLQKLTIDIGKDLCLEKKQQMYGKIDGRSFGRFFGIKKRNASDSQVDTIPDGTEETADIRGKSIWVGLCFDTFSSYTLFVAFWTPIEDKSKYKNNYLEKLMKNHYNFYAEYAYTETGEDKGYWLSIPLNNSLQSNDERDEAKTEIEKIIKDIVDTKQMEESI